MPGYEAKDRRTYVFPLYDYGAGSARVDIVVGPKGKAGRLIDYGVLAVQETFAGTTPASIAVGVTGNADAYGEEMSISTDVTTTVGGKTLRQTYDPVADATSFDALLVAPDLPANTGVLVTSTGGATGPAGQACPYVVIDWDW